MRAEVNNHSKTARFARTARVHVNCPEPHMTQAEAIALRMIAADLASRGTRHRPPPTLRKFSWEKQP